MGFVYRLREIALFDFLPPKTIDEHEANAIKTAIWSSVDKLYKSTKRPTTLFHYTDAAGLKGIVESGKLRSTHIAYMNDASEYLHAVQLLSDDIHRKQASVSDSLQKQLLDYLEPAVSRTRPQDVAPYFVACFSEEEDSLSQWRAYGRGEGGFSIGFDPTALFYKANSLPSYLTPAIYDREQQATLVNEIVTWALNEYSRLAVKYPKEKRDEHRQDWGHVLLWLASAVAPIMKNPAFTEEREWRLIYLLQSKNEIQFLPRTTGLVPFVELKLGEPRSSKDGQSQPDLLPIRKLWSGPGRFTETSLLAGRTLLEQNGYDGVGLAASKIPFRVG